MFERFTDRARRVVVLAQEESRLLDHHCIGTEHLLLGMLREGEGIAAQVLESTGISLEAARTKVVATSSARGSPSPTGHIPFTPRAKKVLELSLREALQLGHNFIGTEHLLLALFREGEGIAAKVLQSLGADFGHMKEQTIGLAGGPTALFETEEVDRPGPHKPEIHPVPSTESALHCSFCSEPQDRVAKLIAGPGVYICDRCVALCQEILDEQLPHPSPEAD